jgi:O-antigen/teichoic acid export membrane protein
MLSNIIIKYFTVALRLAAYLLIAKHTTIADFGTYALSFSYIGIFVLLGGFGFDQLLLRNMMNDSFAYSKEENIHEIISASGVSSILMGLISIILLKLFIPSLSYEDLILLASIIPLNALASILRVHLFAKGYSLRAQLIDVIQVLISTTCVIWVIFLYDSISMTSVFRIFCLSWLGSAFYGFIIDSFSPLSIFRITAKSIIKNIYEAKELAVGKISVMFSARVDVVIMTIAANPIIQANYFFSLKFFEVMQLFPEIVTNVLLPKIIENSKDSIKRKRTFALILIVAFLAFTTLCSLLILAYIEQLIVLIKPELGLVSTILKFTLPVYIVTLTFYPFLQYVYMYKVRNMPFKASVISIFMGVITGLIGIHIDNVIFYCIAGSIPSAFVAVYCFVSINKHWKMTHKNKVL